MSEQTYNATRLAQKTGYSRSFIYAAKRAGFQFTHGMRTTESAFLDWVGAHPRFRMNDFATKGLAKKNRRKIAA